MANTLATALIVDTLANRAVTVLQNRLAPLSAFSTDFGTDTIAPRKTIQVPIATAGSTTLKNPTNWEAGDSALGNIAVTVDQYSQPFHLTNDQIQQGHKLERLIDINLGAFADKIIDVALTPVTTTNFGTAVFTGAASTFGTDDLKTIYGALKKSDVKNLVLDGNYYAQFLPTTLTDIGARPGLAGFSGIFENTRWTGAGANVVGFACHPQALAVGSGLPVTAPGADNEFIAIETVEIPGLNITVQYSIWFSRGTRTLWASYDVMFGAAKGDASALKIITSA